MRSATLKAGIFATVIFAVGLSASALAREANDLAGADLQRLSAGEALVSVTAAPGGGGDIDAVIDIPTSPAKLMALMRDCASAPTFIDGLKSCRVLSEDRVGQTDVREHIVKKFWFLPVTRSVFRSQYDGDRTIIFKRVDGDLRAMEGRWQLVPLHSGASTRVFYTARIDPGVSLPGALVRAAIEAEIPKTLKALRAQAISAAPNARP